MSQPPNPCWIYRIVHFDNVRGILEQGGLWCGNEMIARELPYRQIGLQDLTKNRRDRRVGAGPGGNLNDYVPFYFSPCSIMLFQIHTGKVPTYTEGQEPIVYLATTVEEVVKAGLSYAFTDHHAKTNMASFYDKPEDLERLDWDTIKSTDFKRRDDDPARLDRKQAEFLVHSFVPWPCIRGIGVINKKWRTDCESVLVEFDLATPVRVHTGWYL